MSEIIIDTHIHIWNLKKAAYSWLENDKSILNRTYEFEELLPAFKQAKISKGVLVQAANNLEDTSLMLSTAERYDEVAGVVGWLPLTDPEKTFELLQNRFLKEKYFKGVRHLIHNEPDPDWLLQNEVLESLKLLADNGIPYDIVGIHNEHLETVLEVAEKIPHLNMVLDHLNQPPIALKEKFGRWGELMKSVSLHKNVYAKISGLGTTTGNLTNWMPGDIQDYVAFVLEFFGVERCFCGGDWPVSLLAGSYVRHWDNYQVVLSNILNPSDKDLVLNKNAQRFYKL